MSNRPRGIGLLTVALFTVALAILLLANEVRFQGCVARQDRVTLIDVTAKMTVQQPPKCSRLPFGAG